MANFNPELVKALAYGDVKAFEQIKDLPLPVRMSLGNAVDQLRRDENIVPRSSGMSIYEEKKTSYPDDDAVRQALANPMKLEDDERKRQEKIKKRG